MFSFIAMFILSSLIYCLASAKSSASKSRRTSKPYSDLPIKAPKAIAMGSPIILVPGIPTPIAFFITLELKKISILSGRCSNSSDAFATHNDTAIGSVQPIAGTISCSIKYFIALRSLKDNISVFNYRVSFTISGRGKFTQSVRIKWHCAIKQILSAKCLNIFCN